MELQNTVTSYRIVKTDEIGETAESEKDYDLLNVIMIRRGTKTSSEEIFDYLTAFFTSNIEGICKYVNIKEDAEVMEGVSKMCGLGESIYERGVEEGIEQGIEQGSLNTLVSLVKDGLLKLSDAAVRANMSEVAFSELLKEEETKQISNV